MNAFESTFRGLRREQDPELLEPYSEIIAMKLAYLRLRIALQKEGILRNRDQISELNAGGVEGDNLSTDARLRSLNSSVNSRVSIIEGFQSRVQQLMQFLRSNE